MLLNVNLHILRNSLSMRNFKNPRNIRIISIDQRSAQQTDRHDRWLDKTFLQTFPVISASNAILRPINLSSAAVLVSNLQFQSETESISNRSRQQSVAETLGKYFNNSHQK